MKVLVPVSGGKDSQACLKLAKTQYPEPGAVRGLFCDTQFEHPLTYAHVDKLRALYDVEIDTVCNGSVYEKVIKYGRFPGGGARHCTSELKIIPTREYLKAKASELGHGFEVWYGMRGAESSARSKRYAGMVCDEVYAPNDVIKRYPKYLARMGVMFRLAVLEWSTLDVLDYLGGEENPLYAAGFDRVGCFPCLAAGDPHKEKAFKFDAVGAKHFEIVSVLATEIGKDIFTSKSGQLRNSCGSGCSFCEV